MTRRVIPHSESAESVDDAQHLSGRIYSTGFGIAVRTGHPQSQDDDAEAGVKKVFYTIVTTKLLIPGDGEPIKDAALVVKNKIIDWVGRQADLPNEYTEKPHKLHNVPYLMPGLWDCHVHFAGSNGEREAEEGSTGLSFLADHPTTAGARLARGCWDAIQRGYTSMRDLAGFGCEISKAIEDGIIVGPNIYSAGACLSQLAGHGDVFALPAGDALLNLGVASVKAGQFGAGMSCLVDGVDECRRGVRLQIRRGAKCIKVMASGGVLSRDDNPLYAQFSREELDTIVGTIFVGTRTIVNLLLDSKGEGMPKKMWEKAKLVGTHSLEGYKKAIKAGCTIALGTDTEPGFNMAIELQYAVEAGMSSLEAIKAATANGPLTVAGQAPLTGQLKAGYEADMIGVCDNPVEDVKVLQKKSNIGWVWKGGKLFKGPGIGPWGEEL
ncbi:hypothetical protein H634G_03620 [Metarhizium anisopliae BRIP 53293]|uniref:Amidohydrolase-related domain-containing protein n=1 Tax=Metarhizium anisopliae BRIP 53293 TaxID=1291518 RepID=A0A0D9P4S9_METAN|nr:hypothetical protein H634G_03620 [Metarhizium anisopliae BRIP 53293]KJK95310.1 hypothetical protein H633G_00819 [Metarhizium anisopliae BRIP 53284]